MGIKMGTVCSLYLVLMWLMAIVGWLLLDGLFMVFWWSIQINSWVSLLLYLCIPQSRFVGWCDCHHLTPAKAFLGPGGPATVQDSVALVRRVRALVIRERDPMMDPCQIESVPNFLGKLPSIWFYLWVPNSSVIFVLKASTAAPIMLEYYVMYHAVSFSRGWKDSKT